MSEEQNVLGKEVFSLILWVSVALMIFILIITSAQAVPFTYSVSKQITLSLNDTDASVLVDGIFFTGLNKSLSGVNVGALAVWSNTSEINTSINQIQVLNITNNLDCPYNQSLTILQNVSQQLLNNTINSTNFIDNRMGLVEKNLQDFFSTNVQPLSDKLTQCQKELTDLKISQGDYRANKTAFDSQINSCQDNNAVKDKVLFAASILLIVEFIFLIILFVWALGFNPLKKWRKQE